MHIVLHIERLILDGLPLTGRDAVMFGEAVRRELAELLVVRGVAPGLLGGASVASVPAQSAVRPYALPIETGTRVASAAYRGFGVSGDRER